MDQLLIIGANSVEAVVTSAALAAELPGSPGATRIFLDTWDLSRLGEIPAYRDGQRRTLLLDAVTPALARDPSALRDALAAGCSRSGVTWISTHPLDPADELEGLRRVAVDGGEGGALWRAAATVFALEPRLGGSWSSLLRPPPDELPPSEGAAPELAWRYAIEAARQEPFSLGATTRGLQSGAAPDPDLAAAGRAVLLEQRVLSRESDYFTFPTPNGEGVMIVAPQAAAGHYVEVARDARRHRGCALSVLSFDSTDLAIVEHERRPLDLDARAERIGADHPGAVVRGFGPAGIAIRGEGVGGLEFLERLMAILALAID